MESQDKIQYTTYQDLNKPQIINISIQNINQGFDSKDWKAQFQTITHLRQINSHYSQIFLNQVLPKTFQNIIAQVDNLRSNNSKQALTLVSQIFQHRNISNLNQNIIKSLIGSLFSKSVCEKAFLRNQALKALNLIPSKKNPYIISQLNNYTDSHNGTISELAIKLLYQYINQNEISDVDQQFLKILSRNINGKRAVIQKKAKQILNLLKKRKGQKQFLEQILKSQDLNQDESNTLKRQLSNSNSTKGKPQQSLKDFLKMKKNGMENQN